MTAPTADEARQAWDKATGIAEANEENISYVWEMLKSPWNKLGWVGTALVVAATAVMGMGILVLLPLLAWFLFQTLAVLYVPGTKWFQRQVQSRKSAQQREKVRDILLTKLIGDTMLREKKQEGVDKALSNFLEQNVDLTKVSWQYAVQDYCSPYYKMRERLEAMRKLAANTDTAMSDREIAELENATLDYLRLAYSLLTVHNRMKDDQTKKIEKQIKQIDEQLDNEQLNIAVRKQLEQVRAQHERILERRVSLPARKITMAAQLTAMSETFEELYHRFTSDPSANISDFLDEATSRLSIEEQLTVAAAEAAGADEDLQRRMARVAAKAREKQQAQRG